MRFISNIRKFQVFAIHEERVRLADGTYNVTAPSFLCQWEPFDVTDWERDAARKHFKWRGTVMDQSGKTLDPIDDEHRVSVYDTAAIKDASLRKRVEESLTSNAAFGIDYILVESPTVAPPWPTYDKLVTAGRRTTEMVAEKIAEKVVEDGYDPEAVAAYERTHLNRALVLDKLAGLVPEPEPEPDDEFVAG